MPHNSKWIDVDEYMSPTSSRSLLDLLVQIADQHSQLSINVITLLTHLHHNKAELAQVENESKHRESLLNDEIKSLTERGQKHFDEAQQYQAALE